jgi:hypothetical protein
MAAFLILLGSCSDEADGAALEFDGDDCPGESVVGVIIDRGADPAGSGPVLPTTRGEGVALGLGRGAVHPELAHVVVALTRGATVATDDGAVELVWRDDPGGAVVVHDGDVIATIGVGKENGGYYVSNVQYCDPSPLASATTLLPGS